MAKILLVDDDEQYRAALSGLLEDASHHVTLAEDGLVAQTVFEKNSFDLVISDIRMPNCDGLKLLRWIKDRSQVPVVLITGFSEILETIEGSMLGADGFLAKPFRFADVRQLIDTLVMAKVPTPAPEVDLDINFCRIPLENFVTGSQVSFSVYHRITKSKYLKIAHRGEDIVGSKIDNYKSKGLKYLFLTKEDFSKYVGFTVDISKRVQNAAQISPEKKRSFLRYTAELVIEQAFLKEADAAEFEFANDFMQNALSLLQEQDEAFQLLESMNQGGNYLYAHSLAVSIYSVMIAKHIKWNWPPTLFKVSTAGLMHDIGCREISPAVFEKPRLSHTQEERRLVESHTVRGMELLNQIRGMPEDVILVAYQHHEDCLGAGYPQQLFKMRIHPVARLVGVVDTFCDYTITNPVYEKKTPHEALKMLSQKASSFDPVFFTALKEIFKWEDDSSTVEKTG